MSDADTLRQIAENIEAQEELEDELESYKQECEWLRGQNRWLLDLLDDFGINIEANLSVADVMAIEKALTTVNRPI